MTTKHPSLWIVALLASLLVGCGGGREIPVPSEDAGAGASDVTTVDIGPNTTAVWANQFDRSCQSADDCVPVLEGEVCDCGCRVSAINEEMLTSFQKARKRAADNCSELPNCGTCGEPPEVTCQSGTCAVVGETMPNPNPGEDTAGGDPDTGTGTSDASDASDADAPSDATVDGTSDAAIDAVDGTSDAAIDAIDGTTDTADEKTSDAEDGTTDGTGDTAAEPTDTADDATEDATDAVSDGADDTTADADTAGDAANDVDTD